MYLVPERNLERLRSHIETVNRKAAKLGCQPVTLTVLEYRDAVDDGHVSRVYSVEMVGDPPAVAGWEFCGLLDWTSTDRVIVRSVPGVDLLQFSTATPTCDHCHTARKRNDTFVLRNRETGEYKQVGRNCLRDFCGGVDPHEYASLCQIIGEIPERLAEWEEESEGSQPHAYSLKHVLSLVAYSIRTDGWVSRSVAADRQHAATADRVWSYLTGRSCDQWEITETDKQLAESASSWAVAVDPTSDYLHNIKSVALDRRVTYATIGLVASMIASYQRARDRETRNTNESPGTHIGTPGQRGTFTLIFRGANYFDSAYGTRALLRFEDSSRNACVWWTGASHPAVTPNSTYQVTATVKDHAIYRDNPQTVLTRCRVAPTV